MIYIIKKVTIPTKIISIGNNNNILVTCIQEPQKVKHAEAGNAVQNKHLPVIRALLGRLRRSHMIKISLVCAYRCITLIVIV